MNPRLPSRWSSAGFAPYGCMELALLSYIGMALLNYALGNWGIATAMLAPLAGLLLWTLHTVWRDRCRKGDHIRVSLGPHAGMEGVIVGVSQDGTRLTVQLSSAEQPDPTEFFDYQIRKARPMQEPSQRVAKD